MAKNGNTEEQNESRIEQAMKFFAVEEPSTTAERLRQYARMVSGRRRWGNLAASSWDSDWAGPIIESIALTTELDRGKRLSIADVGAGGGLLGLVVALTCARWRVTAIESSGRKATFMTETAGKLGMENLIVVRERAEKLTGREVFDVVISRAAGTIDVIVPIAAGLLESGGSYIALKGSDPAGELEEASQVLASNGFCAEVVRVALPPGEGTQISLVKASKM
jgi:16S rRNA (guanine527-N7)-methyltransferase